MRTSPRREEILFLISFLKPLDTLTAVIIIRNETATLEDARALEKFSLEDMKRETLILYFFPDAR